MARGSSCFSSRCSSRSFSPSAGRLAAAVAVAALLWFFMFSPWTGNLLSFWLVMSISAVILTTLALCGGAASGSSGFKDAQAGSDCKGCVCAKNVVLQIVVGVVIAFALWGVFWVGDKLSQMMFSFARPQVDNVYGMKAGSSPVMIGLLLLFLIGPAEEFFWRGYVQRSAARLWGDNTGFIVTAAVYALVHIWSFNFMLVMAALVAGGVWGLVYRLKPSLLPALIVSHAVWDALVFVVLPI